MKVLLDTCVWGGAGEPLRAAGHDVIWSGDWDRDPGDQEIMERARVEGRVLVTLDKDFGELVFVRGLSHGGIIRLAGFRAERQGQAVAELLERYGADLDAGAVVTADLTRVRIREG